MEDNQNDGKRWRKRLRPVIFLVVFLLLLLIVPPLVSISRYKSQITRLISESLGRPVRLSSVEMRLFPWPGFEITNLNVAEDPAYGAEPVLHANTVRASIRLLSLWRGRLEIGSISLDEASLNVVRAGPGRWNLAPLFRTAAAKAGSTGTPAGVKRKVPLPYLEATESRINFKDGAEKLPFSLVNAEFELWQESPGDWRVRLRGQPARTDVSLFQEDTGVVRLEASMHHATSLDRMPIQLDLDWRDAQLGQLSRLLFGADPGWRGDLTGNLHLDGTAESAHIVTRLGAEGVHRAEFAPAEPLDFDANCDLVYHFTRRSFDKLNCSSPVGTGRISITGDQQGADAAPRLTAELDHVPVAAGLALLRTVRSGVAPDLQAAGKVTGKIAYDATAPATAETMKPGRASRVHVAEPPAGPLTGSLTVEGLTLSGGGLTQPVEAPKIELKPELPQAAGGHLALGGATAVPLGGTSPMAVNMSLTLDGYRAELRGQASMGRARELTRAAGLEQAPALEGLAGDPLSVDLVAAGPWLVQPGNVEQAPAESDAEAESAKPDKAGMTTAPGGTPATDTLTGTVTLHNANWRADYLANHVQISQATLSLTVGQLRWEPIDFSYGPVKGAAELEVRTDCPPGETCRPRFGVHFSSLDAADLQTAILGAHEKGSLLSSFIDRLHPATSPPWPEMDGTLDADTLVLGPITLTSAAVKLKVTAAGAQISSVTGELLGGRLDASGSFTRAETDEGKPGYTFSGKLVNLSAAAVGKWLGQHWTGGTMNVTGDLALGGYTGKDLADSAKGTLQFDWVRGAVNGKTPGKTRSELLPASLAHFERWSGKADIGSDAVTLGENQVQAGLRRDRVEGSVKFGDPPVISFAAVPTEIAEKPAH